MRFFLVIGCAESCSLAIVRVDGYEAFGVLILG
jgi:hypothetical protein